jgi:hypothetical protein
VTTIPLPVIPSFHAGMTFISNPSPRYVNNLSSENEKQEEEDDEIICFIVNIC